LYRDKVRSFRYIPCNQSYPPRKMRVGRQGKRLQSERHQLRVALDSSDRDSGDARGKREGNRPNARAEIYG
jgi:hypothetical protein